MSMKKRSVFIRVYFGKQLKESIDMKIGVLKIKSAVGTGTAARDMTLIKAFEERGHEVKMIYPDQKKVDAFNETKRSKCYRIMRKFKLRKDVSKWDFYSEEMEMQLNKDKYDVLIGREVEGAYVLCKDFDAVKIFDVGNILYLEQYYLAKYYKDVEEGYRREMEIFRSVDYILIHDQVLLDYLNKLGYPYAEKTIIAKLGSTPTVKKAQYSDEPKIAVLGLQNFFPHDYFFLSYLTKISTHPIDCYGLANSSTCYYPAPLNYKGYRDNLNFLAGYQFGLITVNKDWLRENSPSNKFGGYFAYGLPVLFPKWMKAGYQYKGAIPYDEDNFNEVVARCAKEDVWNKLHMDAIVQAEEMSYKKVWKPVLDIVENNSFA